MYMASREGHTGVVDILLKAGADIHRANTEVHIINYTSAKAHRE